MPWKDQNVAKAKRHEYYLRNKDKFNARSKSYYYHNKPALNAFQREWQKNNLDRVYPRQREWRRKNPEKAKSHQYKYKYGITYEERNSILKHQNNCCAICGTDNPGRGWNIDHCHKTGKVRGILCPTCNSALGYAKDSIEILKKMISYLEISCHLSQ